MSGIEVFTPKVHEITVGGEKIVVGPFKARQFSEMQAAMKPLMAALFRLNPKGEAEQTFVRIVEDAYPDLRRAICAATGVRPEWVDEQDPHDLIAIFALVVDANSNFSRRRIVPALDGLAVTMAQALARPDGAGSSPA